MGKEHVENLNWRQVEARDWHPEGLPLGIRWRPLAVAANGGAFTAIIELPTGFDSRSALACSAELQLFVLSGVLQMGGNRLAAGAYCFHPAGAAQGRWSAGEPVRALAIADRAPRFASADGNDPSPRNAIPCLDSWLLEWMDPLSVSEPSQAYRAGLMVKVLRTDPNTGASVHLAGLMPGWYGFDLEVHPVWEENYCLSGDVHIGQVDGRPGYTMTEGAYFCRPPGIPHGPVLSKNGNVNFCHTPAKLGIDYRPFPDSEGLILAHLRSYPWK